MAVRGGSDPDWTGLQIAVADADVNLPQAGLTDVTVSSVTMTFGRAGLQA
ncbi:TPA: hypothetical protein ACKQBZ_004720 [Stenotrophomonas maltophilia]|uniref:Uncharacterized protein n=1 Tax=Stenotrophomonas maltophilia TaxID=40324 RepID=A0AAJ2JAV9_STEMA|nr:MULTISPECIES: hypothetical protein [Stenotrophomonas]MBH1365313.1 hypothetical protein [Stenotrophomonas maltophilia]MDQ7281813.1 hypothetical protein [Stenotrophomonas sp. Sm6012]MDT3468426.1 hypothetical protein [Stenotrophomonas maltophilia]HDS1124235.1 hypothetical protein [Stenotrophomonas maltophilia]HEL3178568.1 hypothetical protein [Stenotrophomonas maltophilia]